MKNHAGYISEKTLYMLGKNTFGQLGTGTTEDSFKKTPVLDEVVDFSVGFYHTVALLENGNVVCAGQGFGSTFTKMFGLHDIKKVGVSFNKSYAIDKEGRLLYEWSTKDDLRMTETDRRIIDIAIGGKFYYLMDEDGALGMCGSNNYGQLLVKMPYLKNVVWIEDVNAEKIAAGDHHFVYLSGGKVQALGSDLHGQLPRDVYGHVYDISCEECSTTVKTEWFHYMFGMVRFPYEIAPDREKIRAIMVGDQIMLPDKEFVVDIYAE